jgi:hypothetical protein
MLRFQMSSRANANLKFPEIDYTRNEIDTEIPISQGQKYYHRCRCGGGCKGGRRLQGRGGCKGGRRLQGREAAAREGRLQGRGGCKGGAAAREGRLQGRGGCKGGAAVAGCPPHDTLSHRRSAANE